MLLIVGDEKIQKIFHYAVIDLDHNINCTKYFLTIASKLDTDIHSNTCRLAFHGPIVSTLTDRDNISNLKVRLTIISSNNVSNFVYFVLFQTFTLIICGFNSVVKNA